jgi:hypothetical protein
MINAYLAGITSPYEGEDIEIRFCICEGQKILSKKSILLDYQKPAMVGLVALKKLVEELKAHKGKEIAIIVNDPALYELVRGTSTRKDIELQKTAEIMRKELMRFDNIVIKDISKDHTEMMKWNDLLKP